MLGEGPIINHFVSGTGRGGAVTLPRQLRPGGRQSVRRVGVQGVRAAADGGGAGGWEAVVREHRVAAVTVTATHGGDRAMPRAELMSTAISRAIRAPLFPHVTGIRGYRTSFTPRRSPRRAAANHVRTIRIRRTRGSSGSAAWCGGSPIIRTLNIAWVSSPLECKWRFVAYACVAVVIFITLFSTLGLHFLFLEVLSG